MPLSITQILEAAPYILVPVSDEPGELWQVYSDGSRTKFRGCVIPEPRRRERIAA
ncbi:hypothetical protein N1031_07105 [Herbiconiux moechotypicola]|uniref:Uncharacterized protein n=1 Tax=Herbiconiux moechotypicola TaxID=637393 RepID=A0ABP5QB32_9MICO|nr:hypothetical protein [Herbiconiux moechotypicola]MCS5729525.1 hypothetical protein [Herbiconiux moechotypicola]